MDATHSTAIAVEADDNFELGNLAAAAKSYEALSARFGDTPEITARLARLASRPGRRRARRCNRRTTPSTLAIANDYSPVDVSYFQLLVAEIERGVGHYDAAATAFEAALEGAARLRRRDRGSGQGARRARPLRRLREALEAVGRDTRRPRLPRAVGARRPPVRAWQRGSGPQTMERRARRGRLLARAGAHRLSTRRVAVPIGSVAGPAPARCSSHGKTSTFARTHSPTTRLRGRSSAPVTRRGRSRRHSARSRPAYTTRE